MSSRNAVRANPSMQPADGHPHIAIVGRGPAGMTTAIALLRRLRRPFHLWMIDAADFPQSFGNGPAGQALMSERAGQLSALADRPLDFVDWLKAGLDSGRGTVLALRGFENVYVPRSVFRDYLTARFGEAFAARRDTTVQTVSAAVTALRPASGGRLCLALDDGSEMAFDQVFLSTGHGRQGGEAASWRTAEQLLWSRQRKADTPLLVAGDGPRMAAILLHLRTSGHSGQIRILSEGGRLPEPHTATLVDPLTPAVSAATNLAETLHHLRADSARNIAAGGSWQAVTDGLNCQWPAFWRALPLEARKRYWRHLRALHRIRSERIAPELHGRLLRDLRTPATELVDARVIGTVADGVLVRRKGSQRADVMPGRLIDCREDIARPADGLLPEQGPIMHVEDDGRLIRWGAATPGLHVLGRAAGCLRPDIRLFADTVRQIYRAATRLDALRADVSSRSRA
ncbi:FAD/NAD(P)-binding protein [Rhizobium sp. TRM96647]|uniref:FAD/NAD(P)-binding protein n=1 Tax=unclassified Rhizobium TaxID=2613769 RepID=UPI0021E88710|nr:MULTISPECIES: FAD/NAD(P)-binding protein [unclassified Rhizobium]MCV3734949.1 FAD/NAD(P)-binding protein [Rhizobium sp. TRM96647]MCV3757319.1 FAD/NAD(P)-binding protein [Rhizobium sp. TRM96650]